MHDSLIRTNNLKASPRKPLTMFLWGSSAVDVTDAVLRTPTPRFTTKQGERSSATLTLAPGIVPTRYDDFIINATDGTTRLFGGVVDNVTTRPVNEGHGAFVCDLRLIDYMIYTDWSKWSKTYTEATSLHKILYDLVNDALSPYGVTLDAAQDTGDMFPGTPDVPLVFDGMVSDILRNLVGQCDPPRVLRMSPYKALRVFIPGALGPASAVPTDAAPHSIGFEWTNSNWQNANAISLMCGAAGQIIYTNQWQGDGTTMKFEVDIPAVPGVDAQYVVDRVGPDGIHHYENVSPPGDNNGMWWWDTVEGRGTITVNLSSITPMTIPAATDTLTYNYLAKLPYEVTATSGATPYRWYRGTTDELNRAKNQATANAMLLKYNQEPRDATMVSLEAESFQPGQSLPGVTLSWRNISADDFTITQCDFELIDAEDVPPYLLSGHMRVWLVTVSLTESTIYQGSYLDTARAMFGGQSSASITAASTAVPPAPSGGGTTIGPGTPPKLAKWTASNNIGDSLISDDGVTVTVGGNLIVSGSFTPPAGSIAFDRLQVINSGTMLGRLSAGTGPVEPITTLPMSVQDAITHVGTLVAGVWHATPIELNYIGGASSGALLAGAGNGLGVDVEPLGASDIGQFMRSNGTNWEKSVLVLPNAATSSRLVFASSANHWGESPNLTYDGSIFAVAAQVNVTGNFALTGNETLTGYIGSPVFTSQTSGWRIDSTGGADLRYLYSDQMLVKSFIAELETALAGSQLVTKSVTQLAVDYVSTASGAVSTLVVNDLPGQPSTAVFENGDTVGLKTMSRAGGGITIAWTMGIVTAYHDNANGTQSWTYTRGTGTAGGAMPPSVTLKAKSLVLDFGVPDNGYYEVTTLDGTYGSNSPYLQVVTWHTSPLVDAVTQVRVGNLRGITSTANEYGFLAGVYAAQNGRYIRASTSSVDLSNIDLTMWDGTTPVIKLNHTVPSFALGNPLPTGYTAGDGFWMGKDAGPYRWRLGKVPGTGPYIGWDGAALHIDGGAIIQGTITASSLNVTPTAMALNQDPMFETPAAWFPYAGSGTAEGHAFLTVTDGQVGGTIFRNTNLHYAQMRSNVATQFDATRTYRLSCWMRSALGNPSSSSVGAHIGLTMATTDPNAGINLVYYIELALPTDQVWRYYSATIAAGSLAGYRFAYPTVLLNWYPTDPNNPPNGQQDIQDLRLEEVMPGTLIQDGVITTNKIAANTITAANIAADTITAAQIAANAITASELAAGAVVAGKIAAGVITATEIATRTITADRMVVGTLTATEIAVRSVTADRLVANSITANEIAAGTITATQIAANSITTNEIAANTITAADIASGTITGVQIAANTISATNLVAHTITANEIAGATITANQIAAGTITATQIQAHSLTANELSVTQLSAISANLGSINAGSITSVSITASTITGTTITGGTIDTAAGNVILNNNGLTFAGGTGAANQVKWSDGSYIVSGAQFVINGANNVAIYGPGNGGFDYVLFHDGYASFGAHLATSVLTVGGGTTVVWNGGDQVFYGLSSSLRHKDDVSDWNNDGRELLTLTPILFHYKRQQRDQPSRPGRTYRDKEQLGLAAEDLAKVDEHLIYRNDDDQPESPDMMALFACMIALAKTQDARIAALEQKAGY